MVERDFRLPEETLQHVSAISGRAYEIISPVVSEAYRILEKENIPQLMDIVGALRRVNEVFYGSYYTHQQGYSDPQLGYKRIADIEYDLFSFKGKKVEGPVIERAFHTLNQLEWCFLPLASDAARFWEASDRHPDIEFIAQQLVRRAICGRWTSTSSNPVDAVNDVTRTTVGYLNKLFRYARRSTQSIHTTHIYDLDDFEYREEEETPTLKRSIIDVTDRWRESIHDTSLTTVFFYLNQLPPSLRFILLDRCGYIEIGQDTTRLLGADRTWRLQMWRLSRSTFNYRLHIACEKFIEFMQQSEPEKPPISIREIVDDALQKGIVYSKDKRQTRYDAVRIVFLHQLQNRDMEKLFNEREQKIIQLATRLDEHNCFVYSLNDITHMMGMPKRTLLHLMTTMKNRLSTNTEHMFFSSGRKVGKDSILPRLLQLRNDATNIQLSSLSEHELKLLLGITTPDTNGRYLSPRQAVLQMHGSTSQIGELIRSMENSQWLEDLYTHIEEYMHISRFFSPEEQQFAYCILTCIHNGIPVKDPRGRQTFAIARLAKESDTPYHVATSFMRKMKKWK